MDIVKNIIEFLKHWILTQNSLTKASDSRRSGMVASLLMLLFGGATAFGITPGLSTGSHSVTPVIEDITRTQLTGVMTPGLYTQQDSVHNGDTLASLLFRMGVDDQEALAFIGKDKTAVTIFRSMAPGKPISIQKNNNGTLISLRFPLNEKDTLKVTRVADHFVASIVVSQETKELLQATGTINSSLFAAADNAGLPDSITRQLTHLFSTDIDFHNDLRRGDTFSVIYEAASDEFDQIKPGRIMAAEFVNKGQAFRRVFYATNDGGDYFTPEGVGIKASFLRSPIPFSRVTSGFTMERFHPIFKTWRAHKGIDLAAPMGTPVEAVANAVVVFAGWKNGYGNVIELRHSNGVDTVYGHLSGFVRGLRVGEHIRQGELIGYVGMTGWATGPHLHYEFKINNVQRDPQGPEVRRYLNASINIAGRARNQFLVSTAPLIKELNAIRGTASAAANFE
ncbi:MAG TPA: peptidoglycan DD-metalloendopeptidase family protein [Ferrovaceae bacterium]|nr:peptidoglycan DD-metalloendopeptidase family protein [Ferrovaceae bacterium]